MTWLPKSTLLTSEFASVGTPKRDKPGKPSVLLIVDWELISSKAIEATVISANTFRSNPWSLSAANRKSRSRPNRPSIAIRSMKSRASARPKTSNTLSTASSSGARSWKPGPCSTGKSRASLPRSTSVRPSWPTTRNRTNPGLSNTVPPQGRPPGGLVQPQERGGQLVRYKAEEVEIPCTPVNGAMHDEGGTTGKSEVFSLRKTGDDPRYSLLESAQQSGSIPWWVSIHSFQAFRTAGGSTKSSKKFYEFGAFDVVLNVLRRAFSQHLLIHANPVGTQVQVINE